MSKLTVYAPQQSLGLLASLKAAVRGFVDGYDLGYRFFIRDLQAQYRQSVLGLLWVIILPLAQTLIWVLLSKGGVLSVGDTGVPYPIYVLSGMLLWRSLVEGVTTPLTTFNQNKATMRKINFPKESILIASFFKVGFNMLVNLLVLLPFMLYYGVNPGIGILRFLLFAVPALCFALSLGLLLVPFGALFNDINRGLTSILQLLMFAVPVIYPRPTEGLFASITDWNPFALALLSMKDSLLGMHFEMTLPYYIFLAGLILLAISSILLYRHSLAIIIERSGS